MKGWKVKTYASERQKRTTGAPCWKTDGDAAVIRAAGEYIKEIFKDNADGHDTGHMKVFLKEFDSETKQVGMTNEL